MLKFKPNKVADGCFTLNEFGGARPRDRNVEGQKEDKSELVYEYLGKYRY